MRYFALLGEGLHGVRHQSWLQEHPLGIFDPDVVMDVEYRGNYVITTTFLLPPIMKYARDTNWAEVDSSI